jgi:DNA (cytosine-5)-methyltransferase 1
MREKTNRMIDVACVDLFCGAGGLTSGLISEGINVVAGIDVDETCRHPFEANNAARFINQDVGLLTAEHLDELFGAAKVKILAGCAPCQPFSTYAQRYDVVGSPRWGLLYHFSRLIKATLPDLVTMENVPSVAKHAVFDDFVEALQKMDYHVHQEVVDCSLYGLPQNRRRMVLLASRHGRIEVAAPKHDRSTTVRAAIGGLEQRSVIHGGRGSRETRKGLV